MIKSCPYKLRCKDYDPDDKTCTDDYKCGFKSMYKKKIKVEKYEV